MAAKAPQQSRGLTERAGGGKTTETRSQTASEGHLSAQELVGFPFSVSFDRVKGAHAVNLAGSARPFAPAQPPRPGCAARATRGGLSGSSSGS